MRLHTLGHLEAGAGNHGVRGEAASGPLVCCLAQIQPSQRGRDYLLAIDAVAECRGILVRWENVSELV